jgi:hypothetical protein
MCPGHSLSNGVERKNEKEGEREREERYTYVCIYV